MSRRRSFVVLAFALSLVSALVFSFTAEAKPSGGNNRLNAKACQKGGYSNLYPEGGSFPFATEEECTSFAAQGGVLVPPSEGCKALNDSGLDGFCSQRIFFSQPFHQGEIISVTAEKTGSATEFRVKLDTVPTLYDEIKTIPGIITYEFLTNVTVHVIWSGVGVTTATWDISCSAGN